MIHDQKSVQSTFTRVKKTSIWLKRLSTLGIVLFLAFSLSVVLVPEWFANMVTLAYPEVTSATGITDFKRLLFLVMLSVPLLITLYGLWNVRLLFDCYSRGEVFSPAPARIIRRVGLAMLVNVLVSIFIHPLGSVLLTYDNPIGNRQLSVSASSDTYLLLLLGGLLVVIGWVMQEAARISDENSRFV